MNKPYLSSFFRGGGLICSSQIQETSYQEEIIDYDLIREFFLQFDVQCNEINDLSKSIQSQESQDKILKTLKQIQYYSQFINQASRNNQKIREYIKQILQNLETLLDSFINTISQRFISLQILIICNQISRLIFQYYAHDNIPLDQERQQSILATIKQIEDLLNQEGEQVYYNSIYYELFIIKTCIEICPTNSEESKEVLLNIISNISLEELSTDFLTALAQGGLYIYKEIKKRKQTNMFKIIFYLEEFKYRVIERIQQGSGVNKIIKQLANNYNILIKDSNEWLIKCSWIKIISDLIVYKPIITKNQYQIIKNNHQLETEWQSLIQKRILKLVNSKNNIAIIQKSDENSITNRILQQQITKFQTLQDYIINGERNLPKLEQLKGFSNQIQDVANQPANIIVDQFQNIPIGQFIQQLNEYSEKIILYLELIDDFRQEIENQNSNKQYLLTQIEQITTEYDEMSKIRYELLLHNDIIFDFFDNVFSQFTDRGQSNMQLNLLINQTIQYFKIAEILDYQFDDLMTEYKMVTTRQFEEYNFDAQILEKVNIIFPQVKADKLISQLYEIISKNSIIFTIADLINYYKMILIITKQIQQSRKMQLTYYQIFFNIRSILSFNNELDFSIIKELLPKNDFYKEMFYNYSAIKSLSLSYEYINNNREIIIKKLLEKDVQLQIGINLKTLQLNHIIQEFLENQQIISNQIHKNSNQANTLDQNIQYLCFLEYAFVYISRQYKSLNNQITKQLEKIQELIKDQKQENQNTQLEDLIKENFDQLYKDVDNNKFIELIIKRLELYIELRKTPQYQQDLHLYEEIQVLELLIDDMQQKYQNVTREEIIRIIKEQTERLNKKSFIQQQEVNDQSLFIVYQQYLININKIIQDLQLEEKSNNLIQGIPNIINHIKLQKYQDKQIDQQKFIKYKEFYQIITVDLVKVQLILDEQLQILQQQEKKLQLDDVKALITSYEQLSNRVLDNNIKLSIKQKAIQFIKDQFTREEWRIKDYLYQNCLAFNIYLNENNQKVVGQFLLMARFKETDYRIINTLKGKDQIQQMEVLINNLWEETQDQVNNELQLTLNELQALQLSLQSEERKNIREELLQKHKNLEQQLEQQMKNVNEIGDVLGVTVYFLKDIKRDLALIQNKLDNIINSIDQIGQDIKFLRGKTPQQILEIRMQSVLQNKIYQDAQSVYVYMKTLEFDFNSNQEKQEQTPLFNIDNKKNGEVDEFLTQNAKSSLLIHGNAGSGKSLTARKIEEYLWIQYQNQCQNKLWTDMKYHNSPLVPIFMQLPALKDPKFNAIEETLLSLYRFDQKQIDLLKDSAQKGQFRLIFIMDSYDELSQQYQGINLIQTNKIHLWRPQNQISKVITTSRTEAFTNNDYRQWFWENDGSQSLKELRLLPFDDQQRQEFLKQFSILKLRLSIYDLLQVIGKNQDKTQLLQNTQEIFNEFEQQAQFNIKQENRSSLVDKNQLQKLVIIIRDNKNVTLFNQEQETSFSKLILGLWHQNLYNNSIIQMNLYSLLETPYMLNIVAEVLPQMNNQVSQPNGIKQYFIKNYINLTKQFLDSIINNPNGNQEKDILQLKECTGKKLSQDSNKLWETLVEQQFFNNWNVQSSYEDTVIQLQKFQNQLPNLFPINNDEEQMIIIYKSLKSHKLTLFDFFNSFFEQFVEDQRQKLIYSNDIIDQNQFEQDIYKYAMRLSVQMFQRQETVIERKPQGILFREQNSDPYLQFFEDSDQYGNYRKQIRKCIPLGQKGYFYQFRHKSIQEFLFSKESLNLFENAYQVYDLLNELISNLRKQNKQLDIQQLQLDNNLKKQEKSQDEQRKQDNLVEILKKIEISFLNQINLQDTFNFGALKFIKTKFSEESDIQKILYPLILLSSVNQQYTRFSSNCLIILLQCQEFQSRKDFSKIIISEISLDGAIFQNCDLRYSKFNKVSIKGLNLNFSDVSHCEWTNLYSNDLPTIQAQKTDCYSQLSPNRELILSYSKSNQGFVIWNSNSGEQKIQLGEDKNLQAIFSHNGQLILSYDTSSTLILWNVGTFTKIKEYKLKSKIQRMIFSEEDDKIACYDADYIYIINNLDKLNEIVIIRATGESYAIMFDKQFLLTSAMVCDYETACFTIYQQQWDFNSGKMIKEQIAYLAQMVYPVCGFYHSDLLFIALNDHTIQKWDVNQFKQKGTPFTGPTQQISCMDVTQNGKYLVSGGLDSLIIIYDIKSCIKISTLIGSKGLVTSVQFSQDLQLLLTCSENGNIKFWDAKDHKQQEDSTFIESLQFRPDSNQLIYLNNKGQIITNETESGQQINQKISGEIITSMCLHPNGKCLIYSTGFQTKIFDLRLMRQVGKTKQTKDRVQNVGYSSDGSKVFLNDVKNIITIYDSTNWNQLHNYNYRYGTLRLSQNYEFIIYFDGEALCIMDFDTKIHYKFNNQQYIQSFDLAKDNKTLVAVEIKKEGTKQNFILIYDLSQKESKPQKVQINLACQIKQIRINSNNAILIGTNDGDIFTVDPKKEYSLNLLISLQRNIRDIIISPNQKYLTAITGDPILYVSEFEENDSKTFIKYSIPQKLCFNTLIKDLKFENSTIKSHLGYELNKIFAKKI